MIVETSNRPDVPNGANDDVGGAPIFVGGTLPGKTLAAMGAEGCTPVYEVVAAADAGRDVVARGYRARLTAGFSVAELSRPSRASSEG